MGAPKTGAKRGRPAKPTEVHRRNGNPSKKALPAAPVPATALEVVALDSVPAEPVGFDPVASAVWVQLWRAGRKHLSNDSDFVLMSLLCTKVAERTQLAAWLAEDFSRRFYETANGQIVSHPAVKQIDQYDAQITSWLSMLGFSPSDRARLGLAEVRIADALDQFRQRKQASGG